MPVYQVPPFQAEVSRNEPVLLDTNVLVAAFLDDREKYHADAATFLFELDFPLYVSVAVVVETWGMIVGSRGNWQSGFRLISWINTPGTVTLLPATTEYVYAYTAMQGMHVDLVDGLLLQLANEITVQCRLSPPIRIATFDTTDFIRFLRLSSASGWRFRLFDLRTLEDIEI